MDNALHIKNISRNDKINFHQKYVGPETERTWKIT